MIFGARRHGVCFGHVAFDAVYGSAGWLLRELDDEGIPFMGEVRCDQHLFLQDPTPSVPRRTSPMGRPPSLLRTEARAITVSDWLKAQPASAWRRIVLRGGEKGLITIEALSARVWLWDGQEDHARRWHLFMRNRSSRHREVRALQRQGRYLAPSTRLDAGGALLDRTRFTRSQGLPGDGSVPSAQVERMASSHGAGDVGDELSA